jgi:hypothetical protein
VELEKIRQERLSILLAYPHEVAGQDIALLEDLAQQFPFFAPLQLLLAKANQENPAALTAAALHANGSVLHKIINQTEAVTTRPFEFDDEEKAVNQTDNTANNQHTLNTTDALVLESISSSDFFAFEQNLNIEQLPDVFQEDDDEKPAGTSFSVAEKETAENNAYTTPAEEPVSVSNYDDDTLPYTFLWWLAKTRKEHQSIFQPYATVKRNKGGELQQQYVEHIFHIQSPFNAEEVINNTPQGKHIDPKEMAIIDNFLKKDPQISPPKPEQIDNENKAKKSAEDHNDLVSETLAKIYIEQMLYHKAIETYQKLSLKFPEKSRYFADLIQSLEKKI